MSFIDTVLKLKTFITNGLKYSSVAIVIIIPLAIALSYYGFVREEVVILVTEIVIYFAVGEALTNAVLKKIKKEKVEFAEIKILIEQKRLDELQTYKKEDSQFSELLIDKSTDLIKSLVAKKEITPEIQEQAQEIIAEMKKISIPEHEISVR